MAAVVVATAAVVAVATAVVATAVVVATTVVAERVEIVLPELVDGKTAVTAPVIREATPVAAVMTTAAVVVVADPQQAEEVMTTPGTAGLRAETASSSEAGVLQLTTGLLKDVDVSVAALGLFSQFTTPVTGTSNTLHQLHKMTAEIPDATSSAEMVLRVWQKTLHNI